MDEVDRQQLIDEQLDARQRERLNAIFKEWEKDCDEV